ncbi:LysR family transcriptional regulator [Bordetella trematum]|uniref:LysR family transcriptional regulator n=1 Tax=Bordetella trematum TaxID=123899 RepID=UPI00398A4FCD
MELRQLECFLAVAELLHFGNAAQRLHMSQSSVSEAVRNLEHALGGALFDRSSRRVALTALGEALRQEAGPAVLRLNTAWQECRLIASGRKRELKIGFLGGGFYELHQPLVSEFTALYPGVNLEFVELTYVSHFSAITDGAVDVAFCRLPLGGEGLRRGPIVMLDQRMLCVPRDHPLAGETLISPECLAHEKLARLVPGSVSNEWSDYHFPRYTPSGRPIADGPTVRTIREAISVVTSRQGVFMITRRAQRYYDTPNIAFVPIDLPAMPSALAWRADDSRSVIADLNALLMRIAQRHGTIPPGPGLLTI